MDSSRLSSVSFSSSVEDSTSEQDANITLSDRLKVFKTNNFDPNAYVTSKCQTMNEKVPLSLSLAASMGSVIIISHMWVNTSPPFKRECDNLIGYICK